MVEAKTLGKAGARVDVIYTPCHPLVSLGILKETARDMSKGKLATETLMKLGPALVERAREYLMRHGNIKTGKLYDEIVVVPNQDGVTLEARATDRFKEYGKFIEFGFVQKDGTFWGPMPFLRPAAADVMEMSTGAISGEVIRQYQRRIYRTRGAGLGGGITAIGSRFKPGSLPFISLFALRGLKTPFDYRDFE